MIICHFADSDGTRDDSTMEYGSYPSVRMRAGPRPQATPMLHARVNTLKTWEWLGDEATTIVNAATCCANNIIRMILHIN